jgi:hypothetical protein
MDFSHDIRSEDDIRAMVRAYQSAVHGSGEVVRQVISQYPELNHAIQDVRGIAELDHVAAARWERIAVEGIVDAGLEVLDRHAHDAPAVVDAPISQSAGEGGVCMDFGRIIHSVEDVRSVVNAYRGALHGDAEEQSRVFAQYPELRTLVLRTQQAIEWGGDAPGDWEDIGVEALVGRGLKILEERGRSPFQGGESLPESPAGHWSLHELLQYVSGADRQLSVDQRATILSRIADNLARQEGLMQQQDVPVIG